MLARKLGGGQTASADAGPSFATLAGATRPTKALLGTTAAAISGQPARPNRYIAAGLSMRMRWRTASLGAQLSPAGILVTSWHSSGSIHCGVGARAGGEYITIP